MLSQLKTVAADTQARGQNVIDATIPPRRRNELYQNAQTWINQNPKLAAFIALQATLSLPPIILFFVITFATLISSLLVCFAIALTVAFTFTAFVFGFSLLILLPTLFFTTLTATTAYVWCLGTYLLVNKFNNDPRTEKFRARAKDTATTVGLRAGNQLESAADKLSQIAQDGKSARKSSNGGEWRGRADQRAPDFSNVRKPLVAHTNGTEPFSTSNSTLFSDETVTEVARRSGVDTLNKDDDPKSERDFKSGNLPLPVDVAS